MARRLTKDVAKEPLVTGLKSIGQALEGIKTGNRPTDSRLTYMFSRDGDVINFSYIVSKGSTPSSNAIWGLKSNILLDYLFHLDGRPLEYLDQDDVQKVASFVGTVMPRSGTSPTILEKLLDFQDDLRHIKSMYTAGRIDELDWVYNEIQMY